MKLNHETKIQEFNNKVVKATVTLYSIDGYNIMRSQSAVAVCHDEDDFNLEMGASIAEKRALRILLKAVRSEFNSDIKEITTVLKNAESTVEGLTKIIDSVDVKINKVIDATKTNLTD